MKRLSIIGEVLQKASNWFRENLPLKSPNSSAEEVSAHDVDEGMETENMGFTSSIALQYVSQPQVGFTWLEMSIRIQDFRCLSGPKTTILLST